MVSDKSQLDRKLVYNKRTGLFDEVLFSGSTSKQAALQSLPVICSAGSNNTQQVLIVEEEVSVPLVSAPHQEVLTPEEHKRAKEFEYKKSNSLYSDDIAAPNEKEHIFYEQYRALKAIDLIKKAQQLIIDGDLDDELDKLFDAHECLREANDTFFGSREYPLNQETRLLLFRELLNIIKIEDRVWLGCYDTEHFKCLINDVYDHIADQISKDGIGFFREFNDVQDKLSAQENCYSIMNDSIYKQSRGFIDAYPKSFFLYSSTRYQDALEYMLEKQSPMIKYTIRGISQRVQDTFKAKDLDDKWGLIGCENQNWEGHFEKRRDRLQLDRSFKTAVDDLLCELNFLKAIESSHPAYLDAQQALQVIGEHAQVLYERHVKSYRKIANANQRFLNKIFER